jgi:hypothetical protein
VPQELKAEWEGACDRIYASLAASLDETSPISQCSTCPLIMLENGTFVKPMVVYHELYEYKQRPPYYMKYPIRWGKYIQLFGALGVKTKPTHGDNLNVMQAIVTECHGGGNMNPNDFHAFRLAIEHVMSYMDMTGVQAVEGEITHAPDDEMHLRPCQQIIGELMHSV